MTGETTRELPTGEVRHQHPGESAVNALYSLTPAQAREIHARTDGEGPGILHLDESGATVLTIPRPYRAPMAGDWSPWGRVTEVREIAFQIVEVTTAHYGGVWLGWDRVRHLPRGYVPFTGHHSWAERMNDAPMVLSFFLVDADHEQAARLGEVRPGSMISETEMGVRYYPPHNWRLLNRNWKRQERTNVLLIPVGKRIEEHGTAYPQGPVIDLPRAQVTEEALLLIAERWRRRLRCDDVALFDVGPSGVYHRETATAVVKTKGFDAFDD